LQVAEFRSAPAPDKGDASGKEVIMVDSKRYLSAAKEKVKDIGKRVAGTYEDVAGKVTGTEALRKTEEFHHEMEAVYSAVVIRIVKAEERIERVEHALRWAHALCAISLLMGGAALVLWLAR
jgi:uncharacterized Fe-S cluster-containing protein